MLQFDIWQIAVDHFLPKLFTVDYQTAFRSVKWLSWDQRQDTINRVIYQLLKILTVMIRVHSEHVECCLNWNIYDISVNCEI